MGWCPIRFYTPVIYSEFDYFSDDILKLACRSLHIIRVCLKKNFLFWCSFSAFNNTFPQFPASICVLGSSSSSQIFVYANSFEKLLQDFCPFCILFICIHFLYQCTNLKFPHLPFGCQNPSSWQMSLSHFFLNTIWQNITMSNSLNLHYFASLYTIFINPLCSCKFLKYYV